MACLLVGSIIHNIMGAAHGCALSEGMRLEQGRGEWNFCRNAKSIDTGRKTDGNLPGASFVPAGILLQLCALPEAYLARFSCQLKLLSGLALPVLDVHTL